MTWLRSGWRTLRMWRGVLFALLGVGLLCLSPSLGMASPPEVSNVMAVQRPGTKLVDVTYDLYDPDGDATTVRLCLSPDGGASFPIQCVTVSGDVGEGVTSGTGKHIEWDAGIDYPGHVGDDYVVKLTADDGTVPVLPGFVAVPAGVFIMGDGVAVCGEDQREVTLTRDFYLGQHEVTNQEYLEAVQWAYDNGYVSATTTSVLDNLDGSTQRLLRLDSQYSEIQFDGAGTFYLRESPSSYAQSAYPEGYDPADHPVKEVTWYGAARYCDWLSLQEGLPRAYQQSGDWACNGGDPYGALGYRLPTDAEWEYAAQWDDERIYPWGNEALDCSRANGSGCVGWTSPVGSCPDAPVALGLSDMAGNVWEWCNDWLVCGLGATPAADPVGPSSGTSRVARSGSWLDSGEYYIRCASRVDFSPSYNYFGCLGFRASRTLTP